MSILGNRVLRREDPKFLTVGGTYVADLQLPGAAWVTYVRSTVAHARLTEVDVSAARGAPGVIAAFCGADFAAYMQRLSDDYVRIIREANISVN